MSSGPARAGFARPRVALVVHDVDSRMHGGMERVCTELIRRASDEVDFTVISNTLSEDLRGLVEWRRARVPRRPMPLKLLLFFFVGGLQLARGRYDLVNTVGAVVPNRVDVASVHHCHAGFRAKVGRLAPAGPSPARRLNIAINRLLAILAERWCYRPQRVCLLAAVSEEVGSEVAELYPSVPVITTPNGVDLEGFAPDPEVRRAVRREHGVEAEETVALFVGSDWPLKGLEQAIRGLALAVQLCPGPLRLWVLGNGDERRYRALAEACGVGALVHFLGFHPDVERFYKAADVFVFPSLYEAFSLVALEAAACGLALIATPAGGTASLIGAEEAGLLIERTPESIGAAIARLAAQPELRSRLGEAARSRAAEYSWERSVASLMDGYRRLLGERMAPAAEPPASRGQVQRVQP